MTPDTDRPPPGPGRVGSFYELFRLRAGDMARYERLFARYGNTVRLRSPQGDDVVMAFHPDDVQRILLDHTRTTRRDAGTTNWDGSSAVGWSTARGRSGSGSGGWSRTCSTVTVYWSSSRSFAATPTGSWLTGRRAGCAASGT